MNDTFKVAIIGGGSSGLLCATELIRGEFALGGKDVVILEKNDRVGKKLIATGNGQGNLSNQNFSNEFYHGDKDFINAFIATAREINVEDYFYRLGLPFVTVEDGRQYPLSKQASAVLDIIRLNLNYNGVTERVNFYAKKVEYKDQLFYIYSGDTVIKAENVVLAVGGKAGVQFGTDGRSYDLAQGFGHKITNLYPSLVQIKTELPLIRGLKGLKEQAKVTAIDGEHPISSCVGEVLFTDYGLSGNAIFKVSGALASAKNSTVKLEFLPNLTLEQTEKILKDRIDNNLYIDKKDVLCGILNKRIGQAVVKTVPNTTAKTLARAIKNFKLKVTGNMGFNNAQVTKGGIETKDIDARTMQSKFQKGLFVVGESLDVDGDCGGYNLTFAFISGITAARAIKKQYEVKDA